MVRRLRVIGAVLAVAGAFGLAAGASPHRQNKPANAHIDRIFAEWDRRDSPGCAAALYQNGRITYERGYGMADLEHDVAIAPDSVFYVGSVSKQFTAMTAALAIQQGRLSLDDSIRKFLPELPDYVAGIAVQHLIHHTSGLRDYNTLLSIAGRRGDEAFDNLTVLRITAKQRELNFKPGDEFLYSNTGYTLLATVVERAVGKPFATYASEQIFEPLGMAVTHYHVDESRLVKGRAMAYAGRPGTLGLDTPNNERAGAGGLFTNVRDLLRWDENFYDARIGGQSLVAQLQSTGTLNNGTALDYAWGLQIGRYRGLKIVEHGGSLGGYRAHLLRFPEQHFSVALLCNLASIAPGNLARRVADASLGSRFIEPKPVTSSTPPPADGPSAAAANSPPSDPRAPMTDCVGKFYSDEVDATFTVDVTDGTLTLRRDSDAEAARLDPAGPDRFRFRGMTLRFERSPKGDVNALVVDAGRVRGIRFSRVP
jgi:CubicO group peptidase (beta-lactamase class C family)